LRSSSTSKPGRLPYDYKYFSGNLIYVPFVIFLLCSTSSKKAKEKTGVSINKTQEQIRMPTKPAKPGNRFVILDEIDDEYESLQIFYTIPSYK
jgi:hypothetical protein